MQKATNLLALGVLLTGLASGFSQPVITNQPQNQTAIAGTTALFSVGASGAQPLSYQWRSHANPSTFTNIPFSTEATLVLANVQPTSRRFAVVVTDAGGLSATSSPLVTLTVLVPPSITTQPISQAAFVGDTVTFRIVAAGTPPVSCQWLFNNLILLGQTSSNLTLAGVQPVNAGSYAAMVANAAGVTTSQVATLTVTTPGIPHQFAGVNLAQDKTISLALSGSVAVVFKPYFDLYPVDVSSNLLDWQRFDTLMLTNAVVNSVSFRDVEAAHFQYRFYRTPTNHFVTPFPRPTGPYPVGTISRLLTDPSRTNRYNIPTNSSFMVTFWYPAQVQAGQLPSDFVEKVIALDGDYYAEYTNVVPYFKTHSLSNAPAATNQIAFPVVIYSHGAAGLRIVNSQTAENLASQGYIVAAIAHIDCYAQVFPDGREVFGIATDDATLFGSRILDVQFFLEAMLQLNASDSVLRARMDLDKIGAFGFSFGGGTAAEICRIDGRVKAALLLDANVRAATELKQFGVQKPLFSMNSQSCDVDCPGTQALFQKATTNAYWCQIRDTDHSTFSNGAWFRYLTSTSRQAAQAINACTVSFFNKHLKNQDDHLLDDPVAAYPMIYNFQRK